MPTVMTHPQNSMVILVLIYIYIYIYIYIFSLKKRSRCTFLPEIKTTITTKKIELCICKILYYSKRYINGMMKRIGHWVPSVVN